MSFEKHLEEGQILEQAVTDQLNRLLPDTCKAINTSQDNSIDRFIYSTVDVVVMKGDHIVFGIECKYGKEKYNACQALNGWDGDYNTPLNEKSVHRYKEAEFPVYVLNVNSWCGKMFTADLKTILGSPNDGGRNRKYSGEVRYNVDSRQWNNYTYTDNLSLVFPLSDIIDKHKKELCWTYC